MSMLHLTHLKNGEMRYRCIPCGKSTVHTILAKESGQPPAFNFVYDIKCKQCGKIRFYFTNVDQIMDMTTEGVNESTNTYIDSDGHTRCLTCHCYGCEC